MLRMNARLAALGAAVVAVVSPSLIIAPASATTIIYMPDGSRRTDVGLTQNMHTDILLVYSVDEGEVRIDYPGDALYVAQSVVLEPHGDAFLCADDASSDRKVYVTYDPNGASPVTGYGTFGVSSGPSDAASLQRDVDEARSKVQKATAALQKAQRALRKAKRRLAYVRSHDFSDRAVRSAAIDKAKAQRAATRARRYQAKMSMKLNTAVETLKGFEELRASCATRMIG